MQSLVSVSFSDAILFSAADRCSLENCRHSCLALVLGIRIHEETMDDARCFPAGFRHALSAATRLADIKFFVIVL